MAEYILGRIKFVYQGNWTTGTRYIADDIVTVGGKSYICVTGHLAAAAFATDLAANNWKIIADGLKWRSTWTATTLYNPGDLVKYGAVVYQCNTGHTSQASLELDQGKWEVFANGTNYRSAWANATAYSTGDLVTYGGNVYYCATSHTSATSTATLTALSFTVSAGTATLTYSAQALPPYAVGSTVTLAGFTPTQTSGSVNTVNASFTVVTCTTTQVTFALTGTYTSSVLGTVAGTSQLGLEKDQAKWQLFNAGVNYRGEFAASTRYRVNDLAKSGANTYICLIGHTSGANIDTTGVYFAKFVAGLEFESSWNTSTAYQVGDLATYGGYTYVSLQNHTNQNPSTAIAFWTPITTGWTYEGDWNNSTYYKISSVVRLGGYTYLSTVDSPTYTLTATATTAGVPVTVSATSGTLLTVSSTTGLVAGAKITFASDLANLSRFNTYYILSGVTANQFSVSSTPGGAAVALATTTGQNVVATSQGFVTTSATTNLQAGQAITFASSFGGIAAGATYYVLAGSTSTQFNISEVASGNQITLTTTTGQTVSATFTAQPGNAAYWSRLNPGLYWKNTSQTYTGVATSTVLVTNGAATGAAYTVVRNNTVYSLTRTSNGTNYTTGDTIKILGTAVGGLSPVNDITITVTASAGAITAQTSTGVAVTWTGGTNYVLGDVATMGANSYVCILPHYATATNKPDADSQAVYWNLLSAGAEVATLTTAGDTFYYGPNGPARLPIGSVGQVLRSNGNYPTWDNFGHIDKIVYVGPAGVDAPSPTYGQTIDTPWATVRYAAKQIEEGYLNPNAKQLLVTNKQFIMKEVTNFINYTYTVTVTQTIASGNNFVTASTANLNVGMPIKFAGTVFGNVVVGTTYYVKTINVNGTNFTISDTFGGIEFALASATGTMSATLSYIQETCERDTGIIVDALIFDLTHGGNQKSTAAANSYYVPSSNTYITTALGRQVPQSIAGYNYMKTLVGLVLANQAPGTNYQTLNGIATKAIQNINTAYTVESGVPATATALISIVTNGLAGGATSAIPTAINPATTISVKTGTYNEVLPIVIPNYTAVVGDELRSSIIQPKTANPLLVNDKAKTSAALTRFKTIMPTLMANGAVTATSGNTQTQNVSLPAGDIGSTTAVSRVVANATIMYDVLNNGAGSIPVYTLPAPTGHNTSLTNTAYATTGNTTGSTAGYGDAITQIAQNKQFIKDEISAWLAAAGNGYSAVWTALGADGQANCQRDVGYIVDALAYDLTYGGNTQTLIVGASYYTGYTLNVAATEKAATIAAYTWLKSFIDNVAIKDTAGWTKTTGSSQVVTGTAGSANAGSFAQNRIQDIIDWITNGTAPTAVTPCVTAAAYSTALVASYTALQARKLEIQSDSTVWVKKYFQSMNFTEATCYRDVGYIVDALSYDLLTGSNFASSKAAESYLRGTASAQYVLANQKTASLGLINFIMYKSKQTAAAGASTEAQNLIDDIVATINATQLISGLNVQTHGTLSYNNTLATIQGAEILRANKEFLAYEATAYITASYGGTVTTTTAATNLFTLGANHNFVAGDPVVFSGTTYAGSGIAIGTTYYVLAAGLTGTAFTVSATAGGTAIDVTSNGSGSTLVVRYAFDAVSCRRDMREWVEALIYDLQYTGNYRSRRAAELYLNAINGSQMSDMFLVANASGLRNCTLSGLSGGLTAANQYGTKRPTAGAYVALNPGFGPNDSNNWVTTRSHYSQNVTMFGTGCTGAKIDAALHAGGNKSMVKNDFTTILSDGIGVWCTGSGSLTELVSVFNYYGYSGYLAELGGRIRATNGNSSYGTYGVIAEGLDTYETPGYANLNNRGQQAYITNTVTDGANQVLRIEYNNAGIDYTNANFVINGSGFNAATVGDEFRDYGVFETRLVDLNDGFGFGGAGYLTATNTGQSGTATSIVIAAADTGLSQSYVGMQVIITAGTGAGQYARIAAYNSGTKTALVYKPNFEPLTVTGSTTTVLQVASTAQLYVNMPLYFGATTAGILTANTLYYVASVASTTTFTVKSTTGGSAITGLTATSSQTISLLAAGWEHVVPGTAIQSVLDLTATYVIEPAVNYSAPGYTATARSLHTSATWRTVAYGAARYVAVANGSTTTSYSTNGTTWATGGANSSSQTWTDLHYGGGYGATATAVVGGLTGSGGIFTVTRTGTQITSVAVAHGGTGYTTAPTLVVSGGGGSGAVLTCSVLNGAITDVQVIVNGSGYTSNPTVTVVNSVLTSVAVNAWGKDYTSTPTVTISDPFTGTAWSSAGASVVGNYYFHINTAPTPNVKNWYRATSTAGLGTVAPIVTTGTTGSNSNLTYVGTTAIGVPTLTNQGVSSISILTSDNGNPGFGYSATPTVNILDTNAKFIAISGASTNSSYQTVAGLTAGSTWTAGGALPASNMSSLAFGIISGTPIWLAVGGTASGATTNDGATWTSRTPPTTGGTYTGVAFNGAVFVAIASGDSLSSIYNGSTWTAGGVLPTSTTWSSIAFGNGRFVAVASGGRNAAYSIDAGATWYASPAGLPSSQTWTKVAYGQGLFVAVASGTAVCATSPDGVTWTERAMPSSSNWNDVVFGNPSNDPLWVSVSNTSGTVAASINTGATPIARAKVFTNAVTEIRIAEPGSGYSRGNVTATAVTTNVITTNSTVNLANLQPVEFIGCSTSGLSENVTYYVIGSTIVANTSFKVASTLANAALATAVTLSSQTLTGTYRAKPTVTVTDPNSTRTVPTRARMGTGVLGNPTFTNRGTNNATATSAATGDGYSDIYQASSFINVTNVYSAPLAGSNVTFASIPGVYYKLVQVNNISGSPGRYTATFQINPALTVLNAPAHTELITTKLKYSQVRLTGHDFLYIGTGNVAQTNYPFVNISTAVQSQQANSSGGGRVFFTSTDQDGNFNVGNLFSVQQATGTATLNATAFNLSGLQSLQLGSLNVGVGSATITQFSTDPYFTANSDNVLPTQRAIRSYINSQIGGGQSSLNVNTLTSGVVYIANNTITTTTGVGINVKTKMNFTGGIDGAPVALQFFFQK